jgi:hypothetical protein
MVEVREERGVRVRTVMDKIVGQSSASPSKRVERRNLVRMSKRR